MPVPRDKVTVVIPTYDERESIESVARGVRAHGYRLLVVDDDSPDGTGEIADRLSERDGLISVLHRPTKQGLGRAYAAGFEAALRGDPEIVCQMDADLSHDPERLPALVAAVEAGADLAVGSRLIPGGAIVDWPAGRRLLSRWGNRYARVALGVPVRDLTSGFRAFRSHSLQRLESESCRANGYAFQIETVWRAHHAGMHIVEVPITFSERTAGKSKLGGDVVFEAMWLVTLWGFCRAMRRPPPARR
ncbi:MAG: polyprenol monophosphomannose synthase [Acidimicrobiia bacterium]